MKTSQTEWVIDVEKLRKEFYGKAVVDNVSLKVKKGEIYGFLGPNGSGKTSTIRMICGLLTPDQGEGTCLGYNIRTQAKLIKRKVGYMTQKFSLYGDLSVYENLDFVARMYDLQPRQKIVQASIDRLGIGHQRQSQLAGNLSGGWKQRLALAAATIHQPQLLLLDEPTAGVDPKARREFWDEIHRLAAEGITTLVSTHYMDEAERCHRLAYIAYGKLLVSGTIKEVIDYAQLVTWEIKGDHLSHLADKLRLLPSVLQVAQFGLTIHVSGNQEQKLAEELSPYQQMEGYQWRKISASLEDVFIHFMSEVKDTFA
ncbi:MAG: ABC transporter ATP-binding protein [Proteobacteria bacterium]|nr:ABC transporter ATP-binding protein [Pseudomonadota bacterium]